MLNNKLTALREKADSDPDILFSLEKLGKLLLKKEYGVQELEHVIQVCDFAGRLMKIQRVSACSTRKVVFVASVLHDLGTYLFENSSVHHTEISIENLRPFLSQPLRQDGKTAVSIQRCIRRHSVRSKERPKTVPEKIVFDADNLAVFTKFGVSRWFFKAESWGRVKTVQKAEEDLENIFKKARRGQLFYFQSSQEILRGLFYVTKYRK